MKQILFKPFERFSAIQLIGVGLLFTFFGTWLAIIFNARYDGALDFHIYNSCVKGQAILDNIINISCLFIFLFITGKIIYPKTRIVDSLSTAIFSRIPMYLLPLFNFGTVLPKEIDLENEVKMMTYISDNLLPIIFTAIISILCIVWYVALIYNGYKTASNAKGTKAIWIFIGALLLAEIASKVIIYTLN